MTQRLWFLAVLVSACGGGGGGGGAAPASHAIALVVQPLDVGEEGASLPMLVAVKRGGALVRDYRGSVTFETEDRAAWYPAFYRFTFADGGQHLFATGFVFPRGVHVLTAHAEGIDEPATVAVTVEPMSASSNRFPATLDPLQPPGPPQYFSLWKFDALSGWVGDDLAIADVDGDGDSDIVLAVWKPFTLPPGTSMVWLNDGKGTFENSGQELWGGASRVAAADVDGDGDVDLALSGQTVRRWLNDGKGTFGSDVELDAKASELVFGDVDGDSYPDLVTIDFKKNLIIYGNDGKGGFGTVLQSLAIDAPFQQPALGDFDGDGDLDLVAGQHVWMNDGKGSFTKTGQPFTTDVRAAAAGDMDGDGDLDLVIANNMTPNELYVNDGNGTFTLSNAWQPEALCSAYVTLVDAEEDGDLDILVGTISAGSRFYRNDGSAFPLFAAGVGAGVCARLGDLNGDGLPDVATMPLSYLPGATVWAFRND